MNKTYKTIHSTKRKYNMLALPGTNFFKFEIINMFGSHIERLYEQRTGKNVYGISHFIEHLGFRRTKDFTTAELMKHLKNEGTYNASTDFDRINYWFQTDMSRIDLGIQLVANYALNPLIAIPDEEFEIERNVVYNEAKRYADDDQTMFWFNSTGALTGYTAEDNVIGIPETIQTFEIEDCIKIKDMFLSNAENVYNVTYDPTVLTAIEVIEKIENELARHTPLGIAEEVTQAQYDAVVGEVKDVQKVVQNESDQAMTILNFDVVDNVITAGAGNEFLSRYAEDTSLNDIIREKNGLTYGISMGATNISYVPYTYFGCDVTRGTEDKLMELFKESINLSADAFNTKAHEKFITAKKLKRTMSLLDQKNYGSWHDTATWYPEIIEELKDVLAVDLDAAYDKVDELYNTEAKIKAYLETMRDAVNTNSFAKITN